MELSGVLKAVEAEAERCMLERLVLASYRTTGVRQLANKRAAGSSVLMSWSWSWSSLKDCLRHIFESRGKEGRRSIQTAPPLGSSGNRIFSHSSSSPRSCEIQHPLCKPFRGLLIRSINQPLTIFSFIHSFIHSLFINHYLQVEFIYRQLACREDCII